MRLAAAIAALALAAALLPGCGTGTTTTTRPAPAGSSKQAIRAAWARNPHCRHPRGASRWACTVGSYRCQGVVTGRGWSISCAKPGEAVAFTVRPG
ncbi:MAG TPA: hypothetical protein VFL77_05125 [Solirubrobacterales bacterium]|nr:hypothetical protein [Solirubrobacterales bacterium]